MSDSVQPPDPGRRRFFRQFAGEVATSVGSVIGAAQPTTRPPSFSTRSQQAFIVPPVASRSSTTSTRWPFTIASACISSVSLPYSRS